MIGVGAAYGAAAAGGVGEVHARIAAIQSRIDGLTGPRVGRAPIVDAPGRGPVAPPVTFELTSAETRNPAPPPEPASVGATLAAKLPAHAQRWAPAIAAAAEKVGLDPTLLAALVRHESDFDQDVVSHAGAIGLAQLMPGTAGGLGVDPHDPIQNLAGGARYLRDQLDRFGSVDLALAAYNAGPNRVAQAGGVPRIAETTAYVRRVIDTWESLR